MNKDYVTQNRVDFMGLFSERYLASRTFITDIPEFGSLCISLILKEEFIFAYCRSILGRKEFKYPKNNFSDEWENQVLLITVDKYFRSQVHNWETQIKTQYTFFDNFVSFFGKSLISSISSDKVFQPLKELIEAQILSNIKCFKLENIRNRFTEINFFYAEEIENFILRDYLDVKVVEDNSEIITHFREIIVTADDINNMDIKPKDVENGLLTIINEFISTELSVLIIMNDFYYDGVLRNREKLESFKYNEYFKDFENIYNLSKKFVKELVNEFNFFEYQDVDNTLEDLFKDDLPVQKKEKKIKFVDDKDETDWANKLYEIIDKNIEYFNSYGRFVNTYEGVLKNINLKDINKDKLTDTFNIILQRLTKFSPLITRILTFTDQKCRGYLNLKIFLIKIKKFAKWLDHQQDIQYRKEKTWELCIKYNLDDVKGIFIDEISFQDFRLILLADYLLIIDSKGYYIGFLNIKNIDIHEKGDFFFYLITNKKLSMKYYFEFELQNYKMYILNIRCLSKGIRDRFIFNVRSARKKYCLCKESVKCIIKGENVFLIPNLSIKDEEWILIKYKFIMNEIVKANEDNEFIDLSDADISDYLSEINIRL
ncbi:hypothetical protein P3W45_000337 [Vairimorpha bombi]|jgi:hypothetical protein